MEVLSKTKKIVETSKYKITDRVLYIEVKENGKVNKKLSTLKCKDKDLRPICIDRQKLIKGIEKGNTFFEMFHTGASSIMVDFAPTEDNDIVLAYYGGHILFDIDMEPISLPHSFDYCGSLVSRKEDLRFETIIGKLKIHPYVKTLTTKIIEYYNSEFIGQEGIDKCTILLPQDVYTELYELYKDNEFFSCRMKDAIRLSYNLDYVDKIDIYGLNNLVVDYWRTK